MIEIDNDKAHKDYDFVYLKFSLKHCAFNLTFQNYYAF